MKMVKKSKAKEPPPKKTKRTKVERRGNDTGSTGLSVTSVALAPAPARKNPFAGMQNFFKELGAKMSKKKQPLEDIEEDDYEDSYDESYDDDDSSEAESSLEEEDLVEDVNVNMLSKLPTTLNVSFDTARRFNFLVAGPAGSGKSTFSTRLLKRYFPEFEVYHKEGEPTRAINEIGRCEKIEGNTRIIITVVDTPGFGESMHTEDTFEPIEKYVMEQKALYEANDVIRHPNQQEDDSRIHCCFYFLAPHRVTQIDAEFMKMMASKVPIVPIVAKADTMTIKERMTHLKQIHDFLLLKNIQVFDFHEGDFIDASWLDEHTTFNRIGMELQEPEKAQHIFPQIHNVFAVISGQRRYMWGIATEEDPRHSDTHRLHRLLFHEGSLGKLYQRGQEIHELWRNEVDTEKKKQQKILFHKTLVALFFISVLVFSIIYYIFDFHMGVEVDDTLIALNDTDTNQEELITITTEQLTPIDTNVPEL